MLNHVKIWLSKDKNSFLPLVNQLRFIHTIEKNPKATFFFVYDSRLLNNQALNALCAFCKKYKINPVDVLNDVIPFSGNGSEKKLLSIYEDEIFHLADCGNLGAASDILRLLSPVYRLGIYSDFDVKIDTKSLPHEHPIIQVNAPFLIPIYNEVHRDFFSIRTDTKLCNDVIIVANNISPDHPFIAKLHAALLSRCTREGNVAPYSSIKHHSPSAYKLFTLCQAGKTARETRSLVLQQLALGAKQHQSLQQKQIKKYLDKIHLESVLCVYSVHFLRDFLMKMFSSNVDLILSSYSIYSDEYLLSKLFYSQVVTRQNDLSFLTEHLEKKEKEYTDAARKIFQFWKNAPYRQAVIRNTKEKKRNGVSGCVLM